MKCRAAALLASSALVGVEIARAAEPQCITAAQADAIVVTYVPEMLERASRVCAPSLPPGATLRAGRTPLADRFRTDAAGRTNEAARGLERLTGVKPTANDVGKAVSMLASEMNAQIEAIKAANCAKVDEIFSLLRPLSPGDIARLLRVMASLAPEDDEHGSMRICKVGER